MSFFRRYSEDVRVIADIEAETGWEGIRRLRERIDRMKSQNMRLVALAMWREKIKSLPEMSTVLG
jgi:hypothetical protein